MWQSFYLFHIRDLFEGQQKELVQDLYDCLDTHRQQKLSALKPGTKNYLLSLGVGVLLQVAYLDYKEWYAARAGQAAAGLQNYAGQAAAGLQNYTAQELLQRLQRKRAKDFIYVYNKQGKPSFADNLFYFSMSHSGDLCFLAASGTPIGADIQCVRKAEYEKIAMRFFSETELERVLRGETPKERAAAFFPIWCEKEAYGKLIGTGVTKQLASNHTLFAEEIAKKEENGAFLHGELVVNDVKYYYAICRE